MRVSAKVDYALRACAELAAAPPCPVKGERVATAQSIPAKFLEKSLADLVERPGLSGRRKAQAS